MNRRVSPVYSFGPFRLDTRQRVLLSNGQLVPLTPKAVEILVALVERAGQVVTKDELLFRVWADTYVEPSNLTQHVFTLRKALGGPQVYIETVPRRGYRFVATVAEAHATGPSFQRLTFRRGAVLAARFAPDGRAVLYTAAWEGRPAQTYATRLARDDLHEVAPPGVALFAVSRAGELAVSLRPEFVRGYVTHGVLARMAADGGEAREELDDVQAADWSPDGSALAIVREVNGRSRLEYPVGRVLYETGGWVSHPRVSPDGASVAFISHPIHADDGGAVVTVAPGLAPRVLSDGWISAQGLAWAARGEELWFTATSSGSARALYAAGPSGDARIVKAVPGGVTLHDLSPDGKVLITRDDERLGIVAHAPGATQLRDLSWHDWSLARDLSADGEWILFTEAGEGGGATYETYMRRTDGSPAVRLGAGSALALSPDGRWALAKARKEPSGLVLLSTGGGAPRLLPAARLVYHPWASWFPDGRRVLFPANEPDRGTRLYVQALSGGGPRPITRDTEGTYLTTPHAISPDGRYVAAVDSLARAWLYPTTCGEPRAIEGLEEADIPVRWSLDGRGLYVREHGSVPTRLHLVDLGSGGARTFVRELMPSDPAGVREILRVLLTPGGEWCVYTYSRYLSDLYVVEGLG